MDFQGAGNNQGWEWEAEDRLGLTMLGDGVVGLQAQVAALFDAPCLAWETRPVLDVKATRLAKSIWGG